MASVILTTVGGAIGGAYGGLIGRTLLGVAGAYLGGIIDNALFGSDQTSKAPRLESLQVQDSNYGAGIPKLYGNVRVAGNVIWASNLIETVTRTSSSSGGGKGGGSSTTTESVTYKVNLAVALGEGPIGGVVRIWADSKVIYASGWNAGLVTSSSVYTGTTTQNPDPIMEAALGSGNVPAYRGIAYMVIEGLQLADFGNRIPNLSFEIIPIQAAASPKWIPSYLPGNANGYVNPGYISNTSSSANMLLCGQNTCAGPIILGNEETAVRKFMVAGMRSDDPAWTYQGGPGARFAVIEMDSRGATPVPIALYQSAVLGTMDYASLQAWSLSPDGRFAVLSAAFGGSGNQFRLIVYDTVTHQFGTPFDINPLNSNSAIFWLDAQHFVIHHDPTTYNDFDEGIYTFARQGLNIVNLGFTNVFGNVARWTVGSQYMLKVPNGLFFIVSRSSNYNLSGRLLTWNGSGVTVGSEVYLGSFPSGSGSAARLQFHKIGDNEWIMSQGAQIDIRLLSFKLTSTAGSVTFELTRPWQTFVFGGSSSVPYNTHVDITYMGGKIVAVCRNAFSNNYATVEYTLNANNFTESQAYTIIPEFENPGDRGPAFPLSDSKLLILEYTGFYSSLIIGTIFRSRSAGNDRLSSIVTDILSEAGYQSNQYDVTALNGITIPGYIVSDPCTAREAIEPLRAFYPFDLIEEDGILKARAYSATEDATVAISELAAAYDSEEQPDIIEITRKQELELPKELLIDYNDFDKDFQVGTQRARRIVTDAINTSKIQLPVTMSSSDAKQLAESRLFTAWLERVSGKVTVSPKHLDLSPGDVVMFGTTRLRITAITNRGMIQEISGVAVDASTYTSNAVGDGGAGLGGSMPDIAYVTLLLMDLPALLNQHDVPGIFIAVSGYRNWRGGAVYRSSDDEYYPLLTSITYPSIAGYSTTVLGSGSTELLDRLNTVTVTVDNDTLESVTWSALLDGANIALLGNEIIQFQTATLVSAGTYQLSNLLRGRFGTEYAVGTHTAGDRFVLLDSARIKFLEAVNTDYNRTYYFRVVPLGQTLDTAQAYTFQYTFNTLRPYAPVKIQGSRASGTGSDLTITWVRRARINAGWQDSVDVPLDETTESYEIDIMNGSTVVRTLTSTTPTVLYSAAQQTTDWGSPPATYTVNIYQLSSRVGRGRAGNAVI